MSYAGPVSDDLNERVGVLARREIEARVLEPFTRAVAAELGDERTREMLARVVREQARAGGRAMRERALAGGSEEERAGPGLEAFAEGWEPWFRGGALEIREHERTADSWRFDVVRCRYAELYRELGMADLGATLSCNRDAALIEGYDGGIVLERGGTILQGAPVCDFHYRRRRAAGDDPYDARGERSD